MLAAMLLLERQQTSARLHLPAERTAIPGLSCSPTHPKSRHDPPAIMKASTWIMTRGAEDCGAMDSAELGWLAGTPRHGRSARRTGVDGLLVC